MQTITVYEAARRAAHKRALRSASGAGFQTEYQIAGGTWHFPTAGHGYVSAYIPDMGDNLRKVLETTGLQVDQHCIAGEEDCEAAIVFYVAWRTGQPLPDDLVDGLDEEPAYIEDMVERWFTGLTFKIREAIQQDIQEG